MQKNIYTNKKAWIIVLLQMQGLLFAHGVIEVRQASDIQWDTKPFVIEFYRNGCPHCEVMRPIYKDIAEHHAKGVTFYQVEVGNLNFAYEIAKKLCTPTHTVRISGVPFFVFVDASGNVSEMTGQMGRGALEGKIATL